jgi:chromosome segregation ATPase
MADPIGSIGVTAAQDIDLALATKGGPKFMARLQQLGNATDRHEQAFAKLQVGESVKAAFDQAQRKLAEAESTRNQAAKELADARAKADAQIVKANAQRAEADQVVAKANALQSEVDERLNQIAAREQAATEAIAKAERAKADAERLRADLQRRIDYLRTKVQEIAA